MKKWLIRLLAILLCGSMTFPLQSCGDNTDTIYIGINLELSGTLAQYGRACWQGIEMATREQNAKGGIHGKKIVLKQADNRSQNYDSAVCAQRLVDLENCVALIGPSTSGGVKSELLCDLGVPVIVPSATSDTLLPEGDLENSMFRICYTDTAQGKAMAEYAYTLGYRKIAIFTDGGSDYSRGTSEVFRNYFEWLGGTIITQEYYTSGDMDFLAQLGKLKLEQPDAIYLPGFYAEAGMIIRQARELGMDCAFLSGDSFDSGALEELVGSKENLSKIYFTNHYAPGDPSLETFSKAFEQQYGYYPGSYSALGYDAANLLFWAIESAGEQPQEIQRALETMSSFSGVTGRFFFDENYNAVKKVQLNGIENGVRFSVKTGEEN